MDQIQHDKIKEKLAKIKALAERGVGGEKETAMRLTIILVGPARAENVGAAARAMKTMGFRELRIVDSEAHLAPPARWVAHG